MKNPRKKQKYPEMYVWDYADRGENGGVGVLIVYPGKDRHGFCKTETVHFNPYWQNPELVIVCAHNRDYLLTEDSYFQYVGEIK